MKKYKLSMFALLLILSLTNLRCTSSSTIITKKQSIDKEKEILEKVSNKIIAQDTDFINKRKEVKSIQPLILHIHQQKGETNGFKYYSAFFSESGLYTKELPTYLWKMQDVYVSIYLDNGKSLSMHDIPEYLLKDYDQCYRNENSWLILICNDTYKTKVIDMGLVYYLAVKQFQSFSCDNEDLENGQIEIEEADVDTVLMEKIMKSLSFGETSD